MRQVLLSAPPAAAAAELQHSPLEQAADQAGQLLVQHNAAVYHHQEEDRAPPEAAAAAAAAVALGAVSEAQAPEYPAEAPGHAAGEEGAGQLAAGLDGLHAHELLPPELLQQAAALLASIEVDADAAAPAADLQSGVQGDSEADEEDPYLDEWEEEEGQQQGAGAAGSSRGSGWGSEEEGEGAGAGEEEELAADLEPTPEEIELNEAEDLLVYQPEGRDVAAGLRRLQGIYAKLEAMVPAGEPRRQVKGVSARGGAGGSVAGTGFLAAACDVLPASENAGCACQGSCRRRPARFQQAAALTAPLSSPLRRRRSTPPPTTSISSPPPPTHTLARPLSRSGTLS